MVAVDEHHVQARELGLRRVGEQAFAAQRRAQRVAEAARQPGQRLAGIAVRVFHPQVAEARLALQRGHDRGDAVARVEAVQVGQQAQLLPGEDQLAPRQRARQRRAVLAEELHVAGIAFGLGVAGPAGQRGAFAQFGRQFRLEALAAVAQQAIHRVSPGAAQ